MNDDLSDEAFEQWKDLHAWDASDPERVWQECRRRAEAMIEDLESQIENLRDEIREIYESQE